MVEEKRECLLGKSKHNVIADCRGHDFNRPQLLPHTTRYCIIQLLPVDVHFVREKSEESFGVLIKERHNCRSNELHPSEDRTTSLFTLNRGRAAKDTSNRYGSLEGLYVCMFTQESKY